MQQMFLFQSPYLVRTAYTGYTSFLLPLTYPSFKTNMVDKANEMSITFLQAF